ncbi:hypothetical protein [Burkholderia pseudomallei]|uniref:hypothetical protein n=1 Tax=Burkholderia pseudomallei TaxID=28450 RepID=UPI0012B29116|nr:hypothetical protein [Burkholderia pseudomallei]
MTMAWADGSDRSSQRDSYAHRNSKSEIRVSRFALDCLRRLQEVKSTDEFTDPDHPAFFSDHSITWAR